MKNILIEAKRAPLPKWMKRCIIFFLVIGAFFLFSGLIGLISELDGGPGLGSVGEGTVIVAGSDGGAVMHSGGMSLGIISFVVSGVLLAIAFTFVFIDKSHKSDKIIVYEDSIEIVTQKENLRFNLAEVEKCTLVKGITIQIDIVDIHHSYTLFCMEKATEVIKIIRKQKAITSSI